MFYTTLRRVGWPPLIYAMAQAPDTDQGVRFYSGGASATWRPWERRYATLENQLKQGQHVSVTPCLVNANLYSVKYRSKVEVKFHYIDLATGGL